MSLPGPFCHVPGGLPEKDTNIEEWSWKMEQDRYLTTYFGHLNPILPEAVVTLGLFLFQSHRLLLA